MGNSELKVTLKQTGGSLSITIPKTVLQLLGWKKGDAIRLDVDTRAGIIILTKVV